MELLSITFEVVGTILIAWMAISVHHRVLNEHKIDAKVFRAMKREQALGVLGVILVIIGYSIKAYLIL